MILSESRYYSFTFDYLQSILKVLIDLAAILFVDDTDLLHIDMSCDKTASDALGKM